MSNPINELSGNVRENHGKGPARVLRQSGQVPGVVYGKGQPAVSVAINPKEATKMLLSPLKRNIMIHLNLQDQPQKTVMVKDLQIDPVRRNLTHIDFIEIDPKVEIEAEVPFSTFGKSKSVVAGGKLEQVHHTIRVKVLPAEIPVKLELDVTDLEFGSTPASAIKLPKGVLLAGDSHAPVVTIRIPRADKEETPAAGASAAAAPAAAKPAAKSA